MKKQTMFLHDHKKLDDNFRRRPNHDLSLASLLGIVHALKSIVQNTDPHHPQKFKMLQENN